MEIRGINNATPMKGISQVQKKPETTPTPSELKPEDSVQLNSGKEVPVVPQPIEGGVIDNVGQQEPPTSPVTPEPTPNTPNLNNPPFLPYPIAYPVPQPVPEPIIQPVPYPVPVVQEPSVGQVLKYALLGAGLSFLGGLAGAALGSFLMPSMVYPLYFTWPLMWW